jgi:hypothetical protein
MHAKWIHQGLSSLTRAARVHFKSTAHACWVRGLQWASAAHVYWDWDILAWSSWLGVSEALGGNLVWRDKGVEAINNKSPNRWEHPKRLLNQEQIILIEACGLEINDKKRWAAAEAHGYNDRMARIQKGNLIELIWSLKKKK